MTAGEKAGDAPTATCGCGQLLATATADLRWPGLATAIREHGATGRCPFTNLGNTR